MLPRLDNLQKLSAEAYVGVSEDVPEYLEVDVREAQIASLRLSIYESLQTYTKVGIHVLIDGLKSKPELNLTTGTVVSWNKKAERWAIQPTTGPAILLHIRNLLPIFPQQTDLQLKKMMEQAKQERQRNAIELFYFSNNRAGAWATIGTGYQVCPFIVLDRVFEINDAMVPRPKIVFFAQLLQSAVSKSGDGWICRRIENAIERSKPGYVEPENYNGIYSIEDGEKFEDRELPTAYWFLLLISLDIEDFVGAMECIDQIIRDIVAEMWPLHFITEAIHFMAIVDFGLKNRSSCKRMIELYNGYAHPLDRHRFSMGILTLWIDEVPPNKFHKVMLKESELCQLRSNLSTYWSTNCFSSSPWIAHKVAAELGAEYVGPYSNTEMVTMLQESWNRIGYMPRNIRENMDEMKRPGYPHSVTVRYRKSKENERKEIEQDEKRAWQRYEDR